MNVNSWLKKAKTKIAAIDAELIALMMLEEKDRTQLVLRGEQEIPKRAQQVMDGMVDARERGLPLAYILGEKEFYGRSFKVNAHVLIPRPESEALIEVVKELKPQPRTILDMGTGSGCLAVTLALETKARVTAADISPLALRVAAINAVELGARLEIVQSDLMSNLGKEKFDLIVANLPYVDVHWDWCGAELRYEPGIALYAGDGGLELVKKLIKQVKGRCKKLLLEIDPSQRTRLMRFARRHGFKRVKTEGFALLLEAEP